MCELSLSEFGYRDEEARVARRAHDLTHEPTQELPAWLTRKGTWTPFIDVPPQPEEQDP